MRRRWVLVLGAAAAAGLAIGSSAATSPKASSSTPSSRAQDDAAISTPAAATTASGAAPIYEVKTGTVRGLGKVLVDGQNFTLYVFGPDKRSGRSTCYGRCATAWPPLLLPSGVSKVPAGPGIKAGLLGSTKRKDGTVQVTYNKWPLYLWVIDSAPGQATGQDLNNLGGKWYVISPAGKIITKRQ